MKKKNFLHYPEYPGGKEEIKRYISDNLVYPEAAIREKISGTVWLSAEINDNGAVTAVEVEKGLGHGCDEEAIRLILGLRYGGATNRGIRLRVRHRFRIHFDLNGYLRKTAQEERPGNGKQIVYNIKPAAPKENSPGKSLMNTEGVTKPGAVKVPEETKKENRQSYGYTITLGRTAAPDTNNNKDNKETRG